MAQVLDGQAMAARITQDVREQVDLWVRNGKSVPGLAVVLVGSDPASEVYVRRKITACRKAGIRSIEHRLDSGTQEAELLDLIDRLNADSHVDGILVQLPLPPAIDATRVLDRIRPDKDVDGFHPVNVGRLSSGTGGLIPCTPLGIMTLLDSVVDDYRGKNAVVIGKSNIVGKPVAMLLLEREATVTVTHIETLNLSEITRQADIVVAAAGAPHLVRGYWIRPGAIVIDVGITRVTDEGGQTRLVGDCATAELDHALAVTPVPGGVGPMTIASLLSNTLRAAQLRDDG
ncbi:bifunctional methylenetetrahydrofolate dehydrogenase/methenyltetrahydrofolate cyclohydrolase FolD [Novosphingobium flavum]|uniref:Bifunctional protein FolD n=1 Tax=Novosphingobium aerophilum TaxID=2839843 RepID=A0A7X1FAT4_9SPHN|nr:bifunctional methylenetetrahydrofolate dehydrogenase/methenyltetrahydrofolate cyclohydrolase FolD [Novosphingobium aerophilum]MBC2653552.1 bifunctional methylenetetrahydrofolate dehydrogenase/methenyltetrahydrofolate cyclohydrolase FolD [Novosphingobium aerophilum]MBC2663363.1 bifunctional methylenetetrahydrofolate dehydrogenase/methenyltetrahydrofolate cyclohydrolase FolD [Novosphingobium aerophilum]